jgi:transcription-repair coupling factor (superfamily II helicase)
MVNEAIAELNGEVSAEPEEIVLELPAPAYLPPDYVEREDVRLDAYRRLAAVQTSVDVDDIALEWVDRFGSVPAPAAALLQVARVRAECVRTGVTSITVLKNSTMAGPGLVAHISPLRLPQSKQLRLARLYKGAVYREEEQELRLPVRGGPGIAEDLIAALGELVPSAEVSASSSSALQGQSA